MTGSCQTPVPMFLVCMKFIQTTNWVKSDRAHVASVILTLIVEPLLGYQLSWMCHLKTSVPERQRTDKVRQDPLGIDNKRECRVYVGIYMGPVSL